MVCRLEEESSIYPVPLTKMSMGLFLVCSLAPLPSRSVMNLSNQEFKGPIRLHHSQLKSMLNQRKLLRSKWIVMHSKWMVRRVSGWYFTASGNYSATSEWYNADKKVDDTVNDEEFF